MKKKILITLIALTSILFTSCFDPIYGTIRTDVKPEKPTVSGDINTIVRYTVNNKEYLVLSANGGLRYKDATNDSHGSWATYGGLPFSPIHTDYEHDPFLGEKIIKVASDKDTLYLVTVQFGKEGTPKKPKLYAGQVTNWNASTTWNQIKLPAAAPDKEQKDLSLLPLKDGDRFLLGGFNIFSSNDVDPSQRVAYLRYGDPRAIVGKEPTEEEKKLRTPTLYKLSSTGMTPVSESDIKYLVYTKADENSLDKPISGINSVVRYKGISFFLNTPFVSYATLVEEDTAHTDFYFGLGNSLYHAREDVQHSNKFLTDSLDMGRPVASIAICKDAILVGCGSANGEIGGIRKAKRNVSSGALDDISSFNNNAQIQMPPTYLVQALINVDPTKDEKDSILYSAITFPGIGLSSSNRVENIGLWSYYPSRGNWNRE